MNKILAGVLMASVLSVGMPLAASASEHGMRDRDRHGDRHFRHCRLVKKVFWHHGHKRVVYKKVCTRGWGHH